MLIATFALGDMLTTLTKRDKLSVDDHDSWCLTNTDLVTDKSYTKVFMTENTACYAFAACIVADDPSHVVESVQALRDDPAMKPFLP